MSFFSKLRDRLTRSSSKLRDGLDRVVEEGDEGAGTLSDAPPASEPEAPVL